LGAVQAEILEAKGHLVQHFRAQNLALRILQHGSNVL